MGFLQYAAAHLQIGGLSSGALLEKAPTRFDVQSSRSSDKLKNSRTRAEAYEQRFVATPGACQVFN